MKKVFYLGMTLFVFLLITACTTTVVTTEPRFYANNTNTEFEILGEIIYESEERIGYIELLRAARNIYPDCDFVIDIMVDQKSTIKTTMFFFLISRSEISTWVMRGTAIKYK
ncbi:MAG: hypothetical protein FWC12_09240 [Treponema sp.]|nr:hypothetical protein [Treponema sp.]